MKAFHEAGGRYVLAIETTPGVFNSIAENLTKANAERIVAIEAALAAAEKWAMLTQTDCVPWLEQATDALKTL